MRAAGRLENCSMSIMARIESRHVAGSIRLKVSGRLRATDMGRLEHACREALTRQSLQLFLDLTRVTEIDQTAAAVVERLRRRGAQVRRSDTAEAADRRANATPDDAERQPVPEQGAATTDRRITPTG
jgi:anti-anti-sigma regulatory factor